MKPAALIAVVFLAMSTSKAQQSRIPNNEIVLPVADQYYWAGPEGNLGIELIAKFQSEEKLTDILNLHKEVGTFKAKKYPFNTTRWDLRDILISADLNGSGSVAIWRVSGPKPLLLGYLEDLKKGYEDRTVFYDFGYVVLDFKPAAYREREK
jgi:hypothetical protein